MPCETFHRDALTLELRDDPDLVSVLWSGSSTAREPGKFILGVLTKRASHAVRVLYKKSLKWRELSFTALEVFQTPDRRIEIRGV